MIVRTLISADLKKSRMKMVFKKVREKFRRERICPGRSPSQNLEEVLEVAPGVMIGKGQSKLSNVRAMPKDSA